MRGTGASLRPWRYRVAIALVGTVVAGAVSIAMTGGPTSARGLALKAHKPHRTHSFNAPSSGAVVGANLFITNQGSNSVTELRSSDGSYVATISKKQFGFDSPAAITAVGTNLFVANSAGNSVTEFRAAGHKHIRTIDAPGDGISNPIALASSGQDLFVLNGTGSVTELDTATGALMGTASGSAYGFNEPTGLAVADGDVFVANSEGDSVTVLSAADQTFVALLSGPSFAFSDPTGVAFDGSDLWVTDQGSSSVTEFSPTTLSEVNVLTSDNLPQVGPITSGDGYVFTVSPWGSSPMVSQITVSPASVNWMMCNTNGPYLFNNPQALVVAGSNLWVVNEGGNSLTEMDTVSGDLIRTIFNP
jgi:hypothetical protein